MKTLIIIAILCSTSICWSQTNVGVGTSKSTVNVLGQSPHVPFAVIDNDTISSAGQFYCEEWANAQTEWYNLNEFGEIVGTSKVVSKDFYDVTKCYELELKTTIGLDGIGLYTSKNVDWEVDSSQIWAPLPEEKMKLDTFLFKMNELVIDHGKPSYVDTLEGKYIYFKIPANKNENKNYFPNTRCVVYGKRYLVIAYLNNQNEWTLAHLENEYTNNDYKLFTPIALIDIDKDGIPEIIYQDSLGHAFWDKILKIENIETIDSWKVEATSVGGATI
ncbi:MAG: hypothetical protein COA58_11420 [Bacteroidetes bacterium]|nr:MAG: hypothetical protein COA58_11420 [Bacteroidota bacterium]